MPRRSGGRGGSGHKHHVKKVGVGNYKRRLEARGLNRSPVMPSLPVLRKKHGVRGGDALPEAAA